MDRKTVLALVLMVVIIILTPYYQRLIRGDKEPIPEVVEEKRDSVFTASRDKQVKEKDVETEPDVITKTPVTEDPDFQSTSTPEEEVFDTGYVKGDSVKRTIRIENNKYLMVLSNKGGGGLRKFVLKKYEKYDSSLVNMVDTKLNNDLFLSFQDNQGNYVRTNNHLFIQNTSHHNVYLEDDDRFQVNYTLMVQGKKVSKSFIFYGNKYHFDVRVQFENPNELLLSGQYEMGWKNGLPSTESYVEDDYRYNQAYVYMGDELVNYEVSDAEVKEPETLTGTASWMAVRTKYFISSIVNLNNQNNIQSVTLAGQGLEENDYVKRMYNITFNTQYNSENKGDVTRVYMGPLDYSELNQYETNLDLLIMNNGWYERVFRFFSLIVLKVLEFLHRFIPNYGIVILIFSVLVKVIVYPLTKKSYTSMKEMQKVQPIMTEIREKYKSDPQRMNKEMMKLYKEHGVNPMGGCLPMLLQMPLLIALFIVFRSTIQLRGASFIPGWIDDLSRTEALFQLPLSIPFYGNEFNLLPILMAVTMIIQSKMTMQDPKQKAMVYAMPVFLLFVFNQFPSGLNLYYFLFNLLTIVQQKFINRGMSEESPAPQKKKQINSKKSRK
ncbi:MAG: membrane protein insertase YidC [Caldithrix sp.]|nr:membrane protein insertase YidC [Caldithrix sp.]